MLILIFSGYLLLGVPFGESSNVPTSTENCYYTFVVPRDQDGGISGASVTAEVNQLRREVTDLKIALASLLNKVNGLSQQGNGDEKGQSPGGVNFVNWGRTGCPVNTSTIYHGYGAKTILSTKGGGVDYLCLPEDPEWTGNEVAGLQTNTYIYGVEYWANGLPKIFPDGHRHNDMPCAVCDVPDVSQTLMIPAKVSCPSGWSKVYQGIVMAERTASHHLSPSNYICVDKDYEFVSGGSAAENSGYAIPVEVVCGIIPCPPYTNGFELSCVVCTK